MSERYTPKEILTPTPPEQKRPLLEKLASLFEKTALVVGIGAAISASYFGQLGTTPDKLLNPFLFDLARISLGISLTAFTLFALEHGIKKIGAAYIDTLKDLHGHH